MKNRYFRGNKGKAALAFLMALCCFFSAPLAVCAKTQSAEEAGAEESRSKTEEKDIGETQEAWPAGPSILAESGIVMEASTGAILYEKNKDDKHYPASITKIMTVLLGIENCKLDEMVTVPHEAVYMEDKGSHIALDEGEQLTVEQCLYAIMLASANDAAYSLAVHVGGTIENFAAMMNARAKELGCENTNFVNPHGLPDESHVTSAYDMALITKAALSYDIFRTVSGTVFYEIPATEHQKDTIPMYHHHKMLSKGRYYYEGIFLGKPGYTVTALNTLVTCAKREDMELICVTMKTEGRQVYLDTAALFDFGFENFKKVKVSGNETEFEKIPVSFPETDGMKNSAQVSVKIGEDCCVVLPKQAGFSALKKELSYETAEPDSSELAKINYSYGGHFVGSAVLKAAGNNWFNELKQEINNSQMPEDTVSDNRSGKDSEKGRLSMPVRVAFIVLLLAAAGAGALTYYRNLQRERRKRRRRREREDKRDL